MKRREKRKMNLANMKRSETTEQIGQSKRRIWSGIKTSSPHTERRDPDKWAGIESGRNESGRSGSVFAGSAPWLSWSVYRNEIREREDHKSTRRVYGASSGTGLQNGGGIRGRTGPRSDPALSGPRRRVRSGELRRSCENVRTLRRRTGSVGAMPEM